MSKKKPSIIQMKGQLEKKFQEAYGNNPQNQTIINYIVKELAGDQVGNINLQSAMNKKYSDIVQSKQSKIAQQMQQRTTKFLPDSQFQISTKGDEISDGYSLHKGKSSLNVDSQTWGNQAKLLDEQQRILDIEKMKNLKKQQLELVQQLNLIKSDKKNRADADKKSEFRWAEQQQALKKRLKEVKEAREKIVNTSGKTGNCKNAETDENGRRITKEKEEDRKMMKQYSEQLKNQERQREVQKQERVQKIEKITGQYAVTVEKDLQQKIRMEEAKIQKQLDQQNMKYDKEQEMKQKQLQQKQQEMIEELEKQQKIKEQMKLKEKLEDQCYGKQVQTQNKIDEKKSIIKREAKQQQLLAATDHLKEQIIKKQNNKRKA